MQLCQVKSNMPKLYGFPESPPVRSVRMTIAALKLGFIAWEQINTWKNEHLTPEYLKVGSLIQM